MTGTSWPRLRTPEADIWRVGIVERRLGVEPEALHVALHRTAAELLADLRPHRVDRVRQRERQVDVAEVLAAEVVERHAGDRLAVLAAHARVGLVAPRVERRGGGDDLHRRARRIAVLGRAVDERGVLRVAVELREAGRVVDRVRVVARHRGHRQHGARAHVQRDERALVAGRLDRGDGLLLRALASSVVTHGVAAFVLAEQRVEHAPQLVGLPGQLVVARALDAGAADRRERVADGVGEQVGGRVAAAPRVAGPAARSARAPRRPACGSRRGGSSAPAAARGG